MFAGRVAVGKYSEYDVVVVPLKGTKIQGRWETNTDLVMVCINQQRCCVCEPGDHYSRFMEKLGLEEVEAQELAKWLESNF